MSDFAGNSAKLAVESIRNSRHRDHYIQITKQTADEILEEAGHAESLSPCQRYDIWKSSAMKASKLRNDHMHEARRYMSPTALAFSKFIKNKVPTFPVLWKKYRERLFENEEEEFPYLSSAKQHSVFKAIIRASGRTNTKINIVSKVFGFCGTVTLILTFGLLVYSVCQSNNPGMYMLKCTVTMGSGMLGAYAGSTLAFYIAMCLNCGNFKVLIFSVAGGLTFGFAGAVLSDIILSSICDKSFNFRDSVIQMYS